MKALKNYLDKIKPNFEEGGKLHWLYSTYDAVETFLFVPNTTSRTGVHIHDARDSKRTMIIVILALVPALLVGMYNVGLQHYMAIGQRCRCSILPYGTDRHVAADRSLLRGGSSASSLPWLR